MAPQPIGDVINTYFFAKLLVIVDGADTGRNLIFNPTGWHYKFHQGCFFSAIFREHFPAGHKIGNISIRQFIGPRNRQVGPLDRKSVV